MSPAGGGSPAKPSFRSGDCYRPIVRHGAGRAPIIDPDLLRRDYLRNGTSGVAYDKWDDRRKWIDKEPAILEHTRDQETDPATGFDAILIDGLFEKLALECIASQYRTVCGDPTLALDALMQHTVDLEDLLSDLDSSNAEIAWRALRNVTEQFGFGFEQFRRLMRLISGTANPTGLKRIRSWPRRPWSPASSQWIGIGSRVGAVVCVLPWNRTSLVSNMATCGSTSWTILARGLSGIGGTVVNKPDKDR